MNLYPFRIDGGGKQEAVFPFIYDGGQFNDISCVITLMPAGNMGIDTVYKQFLSEFAGADKKVFHCAQRHSRDVASVDRNDIDLIRGADGLATKSRDIGLFVTVADCLPIFLVDVVNGAFSVLHSGWKGTGIVENALRLMNNIYQSKPENIAAVLGPCIRSCCYDVDEERAMLYEKEFGGDEKNTKKFPLGYVVRKREIDNRKKWYIDMQAANAALLVKNGVRNIAYCENCVFTDENFGSFRRQGPKDFTKMMALAISR
jgi:YfiH family protein